MFGIPQRYRCAYFRVLLVPAGQDPLAAACVASPNTTAWVEGLPGARADPGGQNVTPHGVLWIYLENTLHVVLVATGWSCFYSAVVSTQTIHNPYTLLAPQTRCMPGPKQSPTASTFHEIISPKNPISSCLLHSLVIVFSHSPRQSPGHHVCLPSSTFFAKRAPVCTRPSTMPATVKTPPMIAHVVVTKWYLHRSAHTLRPGHRHLAAVSLYDCCTL